MKELNLKKIGLVAQYCLWSSMLSLGMKMNHTRLVIFMLGFIILTTISGMQLKNLLERIESKREKILYLSFLTVSVAITLLLN